MATEHVSAITAYRDTHGYREGWDRHAERWVLLAPPPLGCPASIEARYRQALAATLATDYQESPLPARRGRDSDYQRGYNSGYAAGLKAGRRGGAD